MPTLIGLTLVKINGTFELDVINATWDVPRVVVQQETGGGIKEALGLEKPNGSFTEVISKQGATNWRNLIDFRVDIYDKETRSIIVASFSGANWEGIGGNTDLPSATTKKTIKWKATEVNAV